MCSVGTPPSESGPEPDTDSEIRPIGDIRHTRISRPSRAIGETARTPTVSTHHTHHTDEYNRT